MDSSRPIPIPEFFAETQCLSTKKIKRLLQPKFNKQPPPPKARSTSYVRRINSKMFGNVNIWDGKAHAISFRECADDSITQNKHYDAKRSELYFYQCFTVVSILGAGSFGKVYKVKSKEDGKFYAVKKSKECFKGEHDRLERLEEVKKHEQLPKHPNCVEFIKAWEQKQRLYIQTELCETSLCSLADQNDEISEKLIWKYFVDLLQAVKHLHNHNFIHLDIKPANVFVSSHGVCKLGDFGLVVDLNKMNSYEPMEGDPKYLAAELMKGIFTKSADIFSLGITMLELSCNLDLPHNGENWHKLRSGKIPSQFTNHLSADLKRIISGMMVPDHTMRPTADQILKDPVVEKVAKKRESELNLISWLSYLHYFKYGWNSIVCFWIIFISWILSFSTYKITPTTRHNNDDYSLNISDDDEFDAIIHGSIDESFHLHPPNMSDYADNSEPEDGNNKDFMNMLSDERMVNSTPLRNRSCIHDRFSPVSPMNFYDKNKSQSSLSRVHDRSVDDSSKCHLEPRNLRQLFDSMAVDENEKSFE